MNILVFNGSPKGEVSVTLQYVHYLAKIFPEHTFEIQHVSQRIKALDQNKATFEEVLHKAERADLLLWATPVYYLLVPGQYKRFIELLFEHGAGERLAGKYAAALTTSIHFFDHTAHNYLEAISDDLGLRYLGGFPAHMNDLFYEPRRQQFSAFGTSILEQASRQVMVQRRSNALQPHLLQYVPGEQRPALDASGVRILVLYDGMPGSNVESMARRAARSFDPAGELVHLDQIGIKGGCQGCLQCGYDNQCAYLNKDGFVDFYRQQVQQADLLVFAGEMRDRYLSAKWKTFFDRSFFNGHAPSVTGKQLVWLVSGPLSQEANLRQVLEAYTEVQRANLAGMLSDECSDSRTLDELLDDMAARSLEYARKGYIRPHSFLGYAGAKLFRDDIWGALRPIFQADHAFYRAHKYYDFPTSNLRLRLTTGFFTGLLRISPVRRQFMRRIKKSMTAPFQKLLEEA